MQCPYCPNKKQETIKKNKLNIQNRNVLFLLEQQHRPRHSTIGHTMYANTTPTCHFCACIQVKIYKNQLLIPFIILTNSLFKPSQE